MTFQKISLQKLVFSIVNTLYESKSVRAVDFSNNVIEGGGVMEMFKCSMFPLLQSVNLRSNTIKGTIPSSIACLSSLNVLSFGFNELSGSVPRELERLSKLRMLDIQSNKNLHFDATMLKSLQHLTHLDLAFISRLPLQRRSG